MSLLIILVGYLYLVLKFYFYLAAPNPSCGRWTLSCSIWDLVPWPGIKHRPPALGAQIPSHWTTRKVPVTHNLKENSWCGKNKVLSERHSQSQRPFLHHPDLLWTWEWFSQTTIFLCFKLIFLCHQAIRVQPQC